MKRREKQREETRGFKETKKKRELELPEEGRGRGEGGRGGNKATYSNLT